LGNRVRHERRTGWRAASDAELWRQAVAAGTAGAVSMAILGCAVALARDTTGHDWYSAYKLTLAELAVGAGFDGDAPVEYRNADGAVETVSRSALTYRFRVRWAREDILDAAWDGATLGALCGFGGALLCLVLIRRSLDDLRTRRPAYGPAAAPGRAPTDRSPVSEPPRPAKPAPAVTRQNQPDTGGDDKTTADRRKGDDYGRWV